MASFKTEIEKILKELIDYAPEPEKTGMMLYINQHTVASIIELVEKMLPEEKPPMKSGEPTKDSTDLDKMIWAKKRGYNHALSDIRQKLRK